MSQFVTSGTAKLGVQRQYLDGERDLIGHALAGAVSATEKFKVFERVVLSVSIFVMNCLMVVKFAANVPLHHMAVFKNRVFFSRNKGRNGNPNVSVFLNMTAITSVIKAFERGGALVIGLALSVAKFLFAVGITTRFSPHGLSSPALLTSEKISCVSVSASANAGARYRTIHRFFTELLYVSLQVTRFVAEWLTARSANKLNLSNVRGWSPMNGFMIRHALFSAKPLARVFLSYRKSSATLLTNLVNQHRYSPFVAYGRDNSGLLFR